MAATPGCRIVLVAVDDSEPSELAFQFYVDNVAKPDDFVVFIHTPEYNEFSMASQSVLEQVMKEVDSKVKRLSEKYKDKLEKTDLAGKFKTGVGKPGEVIVKAAKEESAALVITGTRGLGKLKRAFLGSVSDFVVHHSVVPVLVCRFDVKDKDKKH